MQNHKHTFTRITGGVGMEGFIKPTCSCGWVGREEYAWNDYQYTNAGDQEKEHLLAAKRENGKTE